MDEGLMNTEYSTHNDNDGFTLSEWKKGRSERKKAYKKRPFWLNHFDLRVTRLGLFHSKVFGRSYLNFLCNCFLRAFSLVWFSLVSLFNGISILVGYFKPKSFLLNNGIGTIQPIAGGIRYFVTGYYQIRIIYKLIYSAQARNQGRNCHS